MSRREEDDAEDGDVTLASTCREECRGGPCHSSPRACACLLDLPDTVWLQHIAAWLGVREVVTLSLVCKRGHQLAHSMAGSLLRDHGCVPYSSLAMAHNLRQRKRKGGKEARSKQWRQKESIGQEQDKGNEGASDSVDGGDEAYEPQEAHALLSALPSSRHQGQRPLGSLSADAKMLDAARRAWPTLTFPRKLRGHTDLIHRIIALPNARLASASFDTTIRIFDVTTGEALSVLTGHADIVTALLHLPTTAAFPRSVLLSGSQDNALFAWDTSSFTLICSAPSAHTRTITAMISLRSTLLPQSEFLVATAGADARVCLWDYRTLTPLLVLSHHTKVVECLSFLPSHCILATAADDGAIATFQLAARSERVAADGEGDEIETRPEDGELGSNGSDELPSRLPVHIRPLHTTVIGSFTSSLAFVASSLPENYQQSKASRFIPRRNRPRPASSMQQQCDRLRRGGDGDGDGDGGSAFIDGGDDVDWFLVATTEGGKAVSLPFDGARVLNKQRIHSSPVIEGSLALTPHDLLTCGGDGQVRHFRLTEDGRFLLQASLQLFGAVNAMCVTTAPHLFLATCNMDHVIRLHPWKNVCAAISRFARSHTIASRNAREGARSLQSSAPHTPLDAPQEDGHNGQGSREESGSLQHDAYPEISDAYLDALFD